MQTVWSLIIQIFTHSYVQHWTIECWTEEDLYQVKNFIHVLVSFGYLDNHHNDCILTFSLVNALIHKMQQLESQQKMAENKNASTPKDSANGERWQWDYWIEGARLIFSVSDDLLSERDEQTDTENELTRTKGRGQNIAQK